MVLLLHQVPLTPAEQRDVANLCSYKHMKANAQLFDYKLPLASARFPADSGSAMPSIMRTGSFVNKGQAGTAAAKAQLSPEYAQKWAAAEESEFVDENLRCWAREGAACHAQRGRGGDEKSAP